MLANPEQAGLLMVKEIVELDNYRPAVRGLWPAAENLAAHRKAWWLKLSPQFEGFL